MGSKSSQFAAPQPSCYLCMWPESQHPWYLQTASSLFTHLSHKSSSSLTLTAPQDIRLWPVDADQSPKSFDTRPNMIMMLCLHKRISYVRASVLCPIFLTHSPDVLASTVIGITGQVINNTVGFKWAPNQICNSPVECIPGGNLSLSMVSLI